MNADAGASGLHCHLLLLHGFLSVCGTLDYFRVIIYLHRDAAVTSALPDDVK